MSDDLKAAVAALIGGRPTDRMARLSASEAACYRWPEDTAEHRAMRAAFCDGAAHIIGADAMSDDGRKSLIVGNLPEETVAAMKDARMLTPALADFVRRCQAYLEDAPANGGHSDAAGSNAYELIEEAIEAVSGGLMQ